MNPTVLVDDDDEDLPRSQSGSSPQHLLITLLGDYWMSRPEHLPSAALVSLLSEFGVSDVGARSALSRLSRRGLLDSHKVGRRTFYGLTPSVARRIASGTDRIMSFGMSPTWDGHWTVVSYSLPEDRRESRHALRSRLRWMGFAPLYDGVYVSPSADAAATARMLEELDISSATVLRAVAVADAAAGRTPIDAWDLAALARQYHEFVDECTQLLTLLQRGTTSPTQALKARTSVMDTYRRFPGLDPELPLELMPSHWPRPRARALFAEVYDGLAPLAQMRVRQVVAEAAPELAGFVKCHLTTGTPDSLA